MRVMQVLLIMRRLQRDKYNWPSGMRADQDHWQRSRAGFDNNLSATRESP